MTNLGVLLVPKDILRRIIYISRPIRDGGAIFVVGRVPRLRLPRCHPDSINQITNQETGFVETLETGSEASEEKAELLKYAE